VVRISVKDLTKTFGKVVACNDVTLEIEDGLLFTLLGPSGCGKTTLLRMIAGFERPDSGVIYFDGRDVTHLPPNKRDTGMVFQNYALWPHMKVFDNVAYGLRVRKLSKEDVGVRVTEALRLVHLEGLEERTPFQLSGGQQQRVALARALVIRPKVLLLDEPLSNLDAKLRLEMRFEIMRIQRELGITTVYVTHDQEESLSISDGVAIMREGVVQQVGTPKEIYTHPTNTFVADFVGQCNFLPGTVEEVGRHVVVKTDAGAELKVAYHDGLNVGQRVLCTVRPENLFLEEPREEHNVLECKIANVVFLGSSARIYASFGDRRVIAEVDSSVELKSGESVKLYSLPSHMSILPFSESS